MQRILYIADPNMIHDLKWISYFSAQEADYQVFMLVRRCHAELFGVQNLPQIEQKYRLKILGVIDDFSIARFWKTWAQGRKIRQHIIAQHIDILHIMYAEPNALWGNIDLPRHVLRILTTRGTDVLQTIPAFFEKNSLIARLAAYFYRRAFGRFEQITCTSTRQISSVERIAPATKNRLNLVRTGIDIEALDTPAALPRLSSDKPYILFPRNMRPLYNHELALEACALLPEALRQKYQLVFVHRNSPDKDYVEKISARLENQAMSYTFLDLLPPAALFALYRSAAVVVMTPLSDGTPVSALEAMALGAPLLLSPLEYDPDLFPPDAVGILADWTAAHLAARLAALLAHTDQLDTEKAARLARQFANRDTEMQKLAKLYAAYQ